jgi:hypothetical protein
MKTEFEVDFDLDTEDIQDSEKSFAEEWSITVGEDDITIKSVFGHMYGSSSNLNIKLSDGTEIVFKDNCPAWNDWSGRTVNTMTIDGDSVDLEDDFLDSGWNLIDAIMQVYVKNLKSINHE